MINLSLQHYTKQNVKSVNLNNSELVIRKQLPVVIGFDGFTNTLTF